VVVDESVYIGGADEFFKWARATLRYPGKAPNPVLYNQVAKSEYSKFLDTSPYSYAFVDVSIGGAESHRVVFELYKDVCPRTGTSLPLACTCCLCVCVPELKPSTRSLSCLCVHVSACARAVQSRTSLHCVLATAASPPRARHCTTRTRCSTAWLRAAGFKAEVRACSAPLCCRACIIFALAQWS
jgi:hypothetical protein